MDGSGVYKHNERHDRFNVQLTGSEIHHDFTDTVLSGFYTGTDEFSFGLLPNSDDGNVLTINTDELILRLRNGKLQAVCDAEFEVINFELDMEDNEMHVVLIHKNIDDTISVEVTRYDS